MLELPRLLAPDWPTSGCSLHSLGPHSFHQFQSKDRQLVPLLVAASPMHIDIEQFARLLPTLVVVAVFQAPSPESNPHSALPVIATGVLGTTVLG